MRYSIRLPFSVLLLLSVTVVSAVRADSGSDAQFVSDTNSARSAHGLGHYAVASDLTSVARRWAAHMAAHRQLAHNPSYASEVCCWTGVAENVGVGGTVSQIHRAFMASSAHRANILSTSYLQVGIGTARGSDGRLYVDELFRRPAHARSTTTASAPRTAPVHRAVPVVRTPHVRAVDRASRSFVRRPRLLATPHRPPASFPVRMAAAQRAAVPGYADPVGGAVAYVQVVAALTSAGG
jgi:hypothetical protein